MMTRSRKDILSTRSRSDKMQDGTRCEHLRSLKKQSKDLDNRLIQKQKEEREETEIKQFYGGEENEEKSDSTKDKKEERLDSFSFSSDMKFEDMKVREGMMIESSVTHGVNTSKDSFPSLDNKVAEISNNKFATKLATTFPQTLDNKFAETQESESNESMEKEARYFCLNNFMQEPGCEQNNLGGFPKGSVHINDKEYPDPEQCVVNMCMAVNGIAESNFFDQYSRDNHQTYNIVPQGKSFQKHISNIFISLKDEISPLAAQEGIDEKSLNNTLANLFNKLHSMLTPHQFQKIMVAIEMSKGGKRLPVLLDCFNLPSTGGDLDWVLIGGRPTKKEEENLNEEEKMDFAEERSKFEDCGDFSNVCFEMEKKLDEKEKGSDTSAELPEVQFGEIERNVFLPEESVLDKALEEEMEKGGDEEVFQLHEMNKTAVEFECLEDETETNTTIDDGDETSGNLYGPLHKIHNIFQNDNETKEADVVHSSPYALPLYALSCPGGKRRLKKETFMKTTWEENLGMAWEGTDVDWRNVDRLHQVDGKWMVIWKKFGSYDSWVKGPTDASQLTGFEEDKVDLRVTYCRTKSCMESSGQGGGNSSWGRHSSSSNGSSFNKNGSGNDRQGSEDDGNSNNQNNHDRGNDQPGPNNSLPRPRNQMVDTNIPGQDYKAVRKKHSQVTEDQLYDLLGTLSPGTSPNIQEDPGLQDDVNQCFLILLHSLPDHSDPECLVCTVLHSLLMHFAGCQQLYKKCHICWQLLRLCLYHVQKCIRSGKEVKESPADVCHQLIKAADFKVEVVHTQSERLWIKMKKYIINVFHPPVSQGPHGMFSLIENEESNIPASTNQTTSIPGSFDQSPGSSMTSAGALPGSRGLFQASVTASSANGNFIRSGSGRNFQPSLRSIPESPLRNKGLTRLSGRRSRRRLSRQSSNDSTETKCSVDIAGSKSDDGSLMEGGRQLKGAEAPPQSSIGELHNEGFLSLPNVPTDPSSNRSSLGGIDDASITTSMSSASGQNEEGAGGLEIIYSRYKPMMDSNENMFPPEDPYETQKTYGTTGVMSLPMRPNIQLERDQLLSLETAPTGEPGIGEVVYGTRRQIMKVAQYWARIRGNLDHERYKYQLREEGVILDSAKTNLRILRTRFQKKQQWMRLVHLGNGVAGKCHLARDTTSGFKFCVKRIHIAKYEENELMTWSDLDHTSIVKLYGAIRHGCKIYIFCEFIAGGSLTSLINEQRSLNRRLSHWMCLRYFKQLLQVLIYLKSRNILHEDLKADNILVRRHTTLIAVADFGLARRMNVDSEMKGMSPTGSQTQWSPEKATSNGHGFAADVWAAVCILVHMLSGYPPWSKRFPAIQMLHFVIFTQSPPLADVPNNIQEVVRDLITQAFTVDPTLRPTAADLLKHIAFKILDQGAPECYYSTLLSSGQAIPNNMLDPSDNGEKEMEDILVSLAPMSQKTQRAPSTKSMASETEKKENENITGAELSLSENSGTEQESHAGEAAGLDQASLKEAPEEAAGAVGGRVEKEEEQEKSQEQFPNLPTVLSIFVSSGPDGAEGGPESCSGYATSPDSFIDPEECVHSYLSDDIPFLNFTTVPQQLKLYNPSGKDESKKVNTDSERPIQDYPHWSLLLGDQTFSMIDFHDEATADLENEIKCNEGGSEEHADEEVREVDPEPVGHPSSEARGLNNLNTSGNSSRESSVGGRISSHVSSHHSSSHASSAPTSDHGYISPSEMKPLEVVPSNQSVEGRSPVVKAIPEDPFPTSYYPPTNLFDEHFDSGDLFGDPSDKAMVSMFPKEQSRQSPQKVKESHSQMSSLETHISSGVHKSGSSSGSRNVYFVDETEVAEIVEGSPPSDLVYMIKPRSSSTPNASVFNQGTADYAFESGKNVKDCPLESESIDLPDDIAILGESPSGNSRMKSYLNEEKEKTMEKKKHGLHIDVNLTPKKHQYQRNQSTPAVSMIYSRQPRSLPHPKTCPGLIQSNTSKKAEDCSGLGTSLSGEMRPNSNVISETSSAWMSDRGRHSSAEISPSTPKSQFDHQEKEFSALEKSSQSNVSAHEQYQAIADLENESGVDFDMESEVSFQDQLKSIQKTIKDKHIGIDDMGHKYQLVRDDDTPLSPIRVPAKYEEWREVIDLIRSVVMLEGFEHFTLKHDDNVPVDYNAPLTKEDIQIKVCVVQEDQIKDDSNLNCWCIQHEDQLRAMA